MVAVIFACREIRKKGQDDRRPRDPDDANKAAERPAVVPRFDHRALSSLVLDAWLQSDKTATFYYYGIAEDTMMFNASEFVDITDVEVRKRAACYAHASQDPERWYLLQERISRANGLQSGYTDAEGFVRHWQSREDRLP